MKNGIAILVVLSLAACGQPSEDLDENRIPPVQDNVVATFGRNTSVALQNSVRLSSSLIEARLSTTRRDGSNIKRMFERLQIDCTRKRYKALEVSDGREKSVFKLDEASWQDATNGEISGKVVAAACGSATAK